MSERKLLKLEDLVAALELRDDRYDCAAFFADNVEAVVKGESAPGEAMNRFSHEGQSYVLSVLPSGLVELRRTEATDSGCSVTPAECKVAIWGAERLREGLITETLCVLRNEKSAEEKGPPWCWSMIWDGSSWAMYDGTFLRSIKRILWPMAKEAGEDDPPFKTGSTVINATSELRLRPDGDMEYFIDGKLRVLLWHDETGWRVGFPARELWDGGFGRRRPLDQALVDAVSYLTMDLHWKLACVAKEGGRYELEGSSGRVRTVQSPEEILDEAGIEEE